MPKMGIPPVGGLESCVKYYVKMVRPVIEEVVVEVEAGSLDEAQLLASEAAATLPENSWERRIDGAQHAPIVESAVPGPEVSGDVARGCLWPNVSYALLRADIETMEGKFLPQPWMVALSPLSVADLAADWVADLEQVRDSGLEGWIAALGDEDLRSVGHQVLRLVAGGGGQA